jgi:hypothetical protein
MFISRPRNPSTYRLYPTIRLAMLGTLLLALLAACGNGTGGTTGY